MGDASENIKTTAMDNNLGEIADVFVTNLKYARNSNDDRLLFATGIDHYPKGVGGLVKLAARKYRNGRKNNLTT